MSPKFQVNDVVVTLAKVPRYPRRTPVRVVTVDAANGRYQVEFLTDTEYPTGDTANFGEALLSRAHEVPEQRRFN